MKDWDILTEATLDAIRVDPAKKEIRIDVTCRWEDEVRKQIIAQGVEDFLVCDMRLSNIIDRVTKFDTDNYQETEISGRLYFMMRGREPETSDLTWPVLVKKMESIRTGALLLLEIEPVYGATVILLAKSVELETI